MPATAPAVENKEVAEIFDRLADLLEIQESFRVRAYRSAARTIRDLPHRLEASSGRVRTSPNYPAGLDDLDDLRREIAADRG